MITIEHLKEQMRETLEENILPYWLQRAQDYEHGGFYGRITGHDEVMPKANKGAVMNARILWAFSAAYRILKEPEYLKAATRAKDYMLEYFIDKEQGGVYWSLDAYGKPVDSKKQTYAIGFAIYGLSEYARATGDRVALDTAVGLYYDVERHAFDQEYNGYVEALTRDWQPINDMRLSEKDENGSKTMNTHLHIIEPYTNLYRAWKNMMLEKRLRNLIDIFLQKILNQKTSHLDLFFDDRWQGKRNIQSFGHDIEAVWLLHETALVLQDTELIAKVEDKIRHIAAAAQEGIQSDGSMIYERWTDTRETDTQRQWWVMCECMIGHLDLYQHFGDKHALNIALDCWNYIQAHLIDYVNGEWFWSCDENGIPNKEDDKAGFWKCPYHNTRMCLEVIERF